MGRLQGPPSTAPLAPPCGRLICFTWQMFDQRVPRAEVETWRRLGLHYEMQAVPELDLPACLARLPPARTRPVLTTSFALWVTAATHPRPLLSAPSVRVTGPICGGSAQTLTWFCDRLRGPPTVYPHQSCHFVSVSCVAAHTCCRDVPAGTGPEGGHSSSHCAGADRRVPSY